MTIGVNAVDDPPIAIPQTGTVAEGVGLTIILAGVDGDGDLLTALISTLPVNGVLHQAVDGTSRGAPISTVPTPVIDPSMRVIYVSSNGVGDGHDTFGFTVTDGVIDSDEATVTVNLIPSASPTVSITLTVSATQSSTFADEISHQSTLDGFAGEKAIISIASTPVTVVLGAGESENIDTDGDGILDLTVHVTHVEVGMSVTVLLSKYPPALQLAISSSGNTIEGDALEITLETQDTDGVAATSASDIVVHVASSAATGVFDIAQDGAFDGTLITVTIPAGETAVSVFYKDTVLGTVTLTATAQGFPAETGTATQEVTVSSAVTSVNVSGSPVRAGGTVTVTAIGKAGATGAFFVDDIVTEIAMTESTEVAGTYTDEFTPIAGVHSDGVYDIVVKIGVGSQIIAGGVVIDNTAPTRLEPTADPTRIKNGQSLMLTVKSESGLLVSANFSGLDATQSESVALVETEPGTYRVSIVISEDNTADNGQKTIEIIAIDPAGNIAEALTTIELRNFAEFNLTVSEGISLYQIRINRLLIRRRSPLSLILEKELVAFRSGTGINSHSPCRNCG